MANQKHILTFKVYNESIDKEIDLTYTIDFNETIGKYILRKVNESNIRGGGFYQTICGFHQTFAKALHYAWHLSCLQFGKENIIDWDCE